MGTYTANYNLFMPTIGEQGWGELVNGNFSTIDTTMLGLNTRIGTLETDADATDGRIVALENGEFNTDIINGVTIKTGVITVTPKTDGAYHYCYQYLNLLPPKPGVLYTGSIKFKNNNNSRMDFYYYRGVVTQREGIEVSPNATYELTFENIPYLAIESSWAFSYQDFTLT